MALQLLAVPSDPALLDLPWELPLEDWPADQLVPLPRGLSRHVVRFVRLDTAVYAVKEVSEPIALREYGLLRQLERRDLPSVEAVGVLSGRVGADGQPLDAALITRHLQFSLPYRALFSSTLRPNTAVRLLDALAALLVRMHTAGLLLGRLLAVQHAVPARRRSLRRVPRRRRDRRAAQRPLRGPADVRPRPGAHQHRRRAAGPAGRRPAARDDRPGRDLGPGRRALHVPVAGAARLGDLRHRRAVPHRPADPAAQRPRLRRRGAQHRDRHRRAHRPARAEGGRRRPPQPPAAAPDRARRRGEPGPAPAQRPRRLPGGEGRAERGRGDRRAPLGQPTRSSRSCRRSRRSCAESSSRPRSSTRCSSTGGSSPSAPAATSACCPPPRRTSRRCWPTSRTRRPSSARASAPPPSHPTPTDDDEVERSDRVADVLRQAGATRS